MGLYDSAGNIITKFVDSAYSTPDVLEVKNRTLDGKYHVQTIGLAGSILTVDAHLTFEQKQIVDNIKRIGGSIKVLFDGIYYTGLIDGPLSYTRLKFEPYPMFKITMTILINSEEVL